MKSNASCASASHLSRAESLRSKPSNPNRRLPLRASCHALLKKIATQLMAALRFVYAKTKNLGSGAAAADQQARAAQSQQRG